MTIAGCVYGLRTRQHVQYKKKIAKELLLLLEILRMTQLVATISQGVSWCMTDIRIYIAYLIRGEEAPRSCAQIRDG